MNNTPQHNDQLKLYAGTLSVVTFCLFVIGLIAIYAASAMKGAQLYESSMIYLKKQLIAGSVGACFGVIVLFLPFSWFERLSLPLLIASVLLLALIFVPGLSSSGNGAERWLNLVILRFQPSELTKIALIFFLAKSLSRSSVDINDWKQGVFPIMSIFGVLCILLLKQPDLGTAVLLGALLLVMMFNAGLKKRWILLCFLCGALTLFVSIQIAPYRLKRLLSFLDPWSQFKDGGFQIIQSLLAFKNGGLWGSGLGESKQKLYFLPEAHTDFILSVLGEELGLIGVAFVVILFFIFCLTGYRLSTKQPNSFRKHLAFGLTSCITIQALINMGVATGLLPTKGMPLPFISSGANSLIASFCMTAMLIRLAKEPSEGYTTG